MDGDRPIQTKIKLALQQLMSTNSKSKRNSFNTFGD